MSVQDVRVCRVFLAHRTYFISKRRLRRNTEESIKVMPINGKDGFAEIASDKKQRTSCRKGTQLKESDSSTRRHNNDQKTIKEEEEEEGPKRKRRASINNKLQEARE